MNIDQYSYFIKNSYLNHMIECQKEKLKEIFIYVGNKTFLKREKNEQNKKKFSL
jgi:putative heme degradation protein